MTEAMTEAMTEGWSEPGTHSSWDQPQLRRHIYVRRIQTHR